MVKKDFYMAPDIDDVLLEEGQCIAASNGYEVEDFSNEGDLF